MSKHAFLKQMQIKDHLPTKTIAGPTQAPPWSRMLLGGVMVALAILGYSNYQVVRQNQLNQFKTNAFLKAKAEVNRIDGWLAIHTGKVRTIAYNPLVRSMDWSKVEPYLQSEAIRVQGFHKFLYAQPNGTYFTTQVGQVRGTTLANRPYFKTAINGKINISPPYTSDTLDQSFVSILTPIYPPKGTAKDPHQPVGVLGGAVSVDRINRIIERLQYGQDSYAFVIGHNGKHILGQAPKQMPDFRRSGNPEGSTQLTDNAPQPVGPPEGIRLERIDYKSQYVVYVPLQEASWSIALVIPSENIEHQLFPLDIIAASTATLIGLMLALLWQVQRAERRRLKSAMQRDQILQHLMAQIRDSLDFDEILRNTLRSMQEVFHLDRVGFAWYQPSEYKADWHVAKLIGPTMQPPFADPFGDNAQPMTWQPHTAELLRGKTVVHESLSDDVQSALYVPITTTVAAKTAVLICENFQQNSAWNDSEIELIQAISEQLAIALNQVGLFEQARSKATELEATLKELRLTQMQMIQSEKMSSLGQMVAGVAHEINNPVTFIHANLTPAQGYTENLLGLVKLYAKHYPTPDTEIAQYSERVDVDFIYQDLPKIMQSMETGTERIRDIVFSLREFVQLDEAGLKSLDIHEGLSSALMLLQNRLKRQSDRRKITVIQLYGDLPPIKCYANQINQVFMSILNNAIDALGQCDPEREPTIIIETQALSSQQIQIQIGNNGPAVREGLQSKLFDPFFTTKPIGKATGMGLSISYQIIVERHNGSLECQSDTQGVTFVITLPIQQ